jgi:exopolyphosphatase/guanosine-5'-triphosphate,3'-diphosphate pyrophosphatase
MRLATIDLGTNTVRLLVADLTAGGSWTPVHRAQTVTRLGEGLARAGVLAPSPMARTAATVQQYAARARDLGAARIRIVATSAVREAPNGRDFARTLEAMADARVEVVSGDDEARLTVRGVLGALGEPAGTLLVFDIGGGSTEYTLVRDRAISATISLRLGVVSLAERHPFPGRVDADRYGIMAREIDAMLWRDIPRPIQEASVDQLVGTAGTVTTLAALDLGLAVYDPARVEGHRLSRAAIARERQRLGTLTVDERAALPCLEPGRADLIVAGVAVVEATMALARVDILVVSDAGLREGILAEIVDTLA